MKLTVEQARELIKEAFKKYYMRCDNVEAVDRCIDKILEQAIEEKDEEIERLKD